MEASSNFPHVLNCGLPVLRDRRVRKFPEEACRLDALLSLMAKLDDTCVLYRGGMEALRVVKSDARAVLDAGGYSNANGRQRMRELDRELIARHVSPGGSADLLAATIFLDALEYQQSEVLKDQSEAEVRDGAA
jgi:triphosphoribosyl-dephospho-CoA synthase